MRANRPMKFLAYIHSSGSLIVRKYKGELDHQQMRRCMKEDIGAFDADNIEQAREIARNLRSTPVYFRSKQHG